MKQLLISALLLFSLKVSAQQRLEVRVTDKQSNKPIPGVSVVLNPSAMGKITDSSGMVVFGQVVTGRAIIVASHLGFETDSIQVNIPVEGIQVISLTSTATALADFEVIATTRTNEPIENATTKVEVLGLEEMNEESTMKPGNIASILGDVSGVQIQQSSAVNGNANVRIQGLDGRYTQMLRDGMPLYEGFSGGFGVLSILPLDLRQVELIKGSASTLYGGGAIGGLINFVSKKPGFSPEASILLNQTSLKETNANAYFAKRGKKFGVTLFAGQTFQNEVDVDKDGLSDVPKISSTTIHPVLFFYPTANSSISLGYSGSFDKREGGDMLVIQKGASAGHAYVENNDLTRHSFTLIADNRLSNCVSAVIKGSFSNFSREITTNTYHFLGDQKNYYAEASVFAKGGKHIFIGGINLTGDDFSPGKTTPAPVGNIRNNVMGIFAQDTWQILSSMKLETGLRLDHHDKYGNFLLPRIAVFNKWGEHWGTRFGFGMGYRNPNPLTPQNKDYDIYEILPIASTVTAETSAGANAEVNYHVDWDEHSSLFINHAFFLTSIRHPVVGLEDAAGKLYFQNQQKSILTRGFDTYIQATVQGWEFYIGYTYTIAERRYLAQNREMPLTPQNRAASTIVFEPGDKWRFGIEASYNGKQYRDGDVTTRDYLFVAAMAERHLSPKWTIVLNCENLFDARQTKYETIYTGSILKPSYKPLWAPLDGRIVNLCLRWKPFAAE